MNNLAYNNEYYFSKYPKEMDEIIKTRNLIIKIIPNDINPLVEKRIKPIKVSTAKQYIEYLNDEINFWKEFDKENKASEFSRVETLIHERNNFNNSMKYFSEGNKINAQSQLNQSINALSIGCLYSKTSLAKFIIKNIAKEAQFFRGLKFGLKNTKNDNNPYTTILDYEGIIAAINYLKLQRTVDISESINLSLEENINNANEKYTNLNTEYVNSFHEQEKRIEEFEKNINNIIEKLNEDCKEYYNEREKRNIALEKKYQDLLRLEKPADYWNTLETEYLNKGKTWFKVCIAWTVVLMIFLLVILIKVPNIFTDGANILDLFKNSAIITIIASVGIYVLNIIVKMMLSSYHLARDAKERYSLAYFYLALDDEAVVNENERAIILNSLFSRADSGLLKGDAAPSMSGDILSLLNKYNT